MAEDHRVNINRSDKWEALVQNLTTKALMGKKNPVFRTIKELMCFAAFLGYSKGHREPLGEGKKHDIQWMIFENDDSKDFVHLIAVADRKDTEILKEGKHSECVKIFEEYANGGLKLIADAQSRFNTGENNPDKAIMELLDEMGCLTKAVEPATGENISFDA